MAVLYDDDFQSYAVNATPPYGNLGLYAGSFPANIVTSPAGPYGDAKCVQPQQTTTRLKYPNVTLSPVINFYQQFSVMFAYRVQSAADSLHCTPLNFVSATNETGTISNLMVVRIEIDGTISLCNDPGPGTTYANSGNFAISANDWNFIQVNVAFGTNIGGFVTCTASVVLNQVTVISSATFTTTLNAAALPGLYCNGILIGGGGNGTQLGRLTIYDAVQSNPTNPHPGSPQAQVSQGVIEIPELITTAQALVSQGVIELVAHDAGASLSLACPVEGTMVVGTPYDGFLVASGGTPPYVLYEIISGALPPGIILNPTTGELSGLPITSGTYAYTARVTDFNGLMATVMCSFEVDLPGTCAPRLGPKLYFWEPSYLERPEDIAERATDFEDAGLVGAKFMQGFTLQADTMGQDKMIQIQGDAAAPLQTYTINHNGEVILPYVFDPAKIASLVRVIGLDSVPWRFFGIRYIWEPVPELVTYYETQGTTHDLPGYQFLKDGYIALISTQDVTLTINVDGTNFVYTIPSTGGLYRKNYILFGINPSTGQTLKGKLYTYILQSTAGFRLFQKDCEIRTHSWAGGNYIVRQPFGDTSRVYGARI